MNPRCIQNWFWLPSDLKWRITTVNDGSQQKGIHSRIFPAEYFVLYRIFHHTARQAASFNRYPKKMKVFFLLKSSDFKDVYFSFSLILVVALFCIFFRGWWFAIESQWSKTKGCDNKELTFAAKLLKSVKSVYSNVLLCIKWSWQFLTILLPNKVLHHVESRELSDEVCVHD